VIGAAASQLRNFDDSGPIALVRSKGSSPKTDPAQLIPY
jgi:hypothetical protein